MDAFCREPIRHRADMLNLDKNGTQDASTRRVGNFELRYCSGAQAWHSDTLTGEIRGGSVLKRINPSEVEQKLLPPVLLETGVPTTTNSLHNCSLHTAMTLKRNPDFAHHVPAVQVGFPTVASMRPAWSAV